MTLLRYTLLASLLWTLPSFVLAYFSPVLSSALSHLTFALLILYFIFEENRGPVLTVFVVLGLTYFIIAGLNYIPIPSTDYLIVIVKYLIVVICGTELLRKSSINELFIILIVGALSITIHALFFPFYNALFSPDYGRFNGFYRDPNSAGAVCLLGLALSFGIKNNKLRFIGFLVFAIGGFFTFSRYFLLMFLIINLILIIIDRRFILIPIIAVCCLSLIFIFGSNLNLNAERFNALGNIFSGADRDAGVKVLEEDSRTATWAIYKDLILSEPISGHGYLQLQGRGVEYKVGVHNTYLMVIGEAGIIPFLILLGIYFFFLKKGYDNFRSEPKNFALAIVLFTALLVAHTYFAELTLLLMSIYLYIALTEGRKLVNELDGVGLEKELSSASRG